MLSRNEYYAGEPQGSQAYGACRPVGKNPCGRRHTGDDYSHSRTPDVVEVPYVRPGVVVGIQHDRPGLDNGYGNQVVVRHADGSRMSYGHLGRITAKEGQAVDVTDSPGTEGSTGFVDGNVVHLEYFTPDGVRSDPRPSVVAAMAQISGGGDLSLPPKPKEIRVKTYHVKDATARAKGREVGPNERFHLHTTLDALAKNATNVVGNPGPYSITPHVYAEGTPGDMFDLVLLWDDTRTDGPHSVHYVERIAIGRDGTARRSVEFKRTVADGFAVYLRLDAARANVAPINVTLLDCDAYLFTVA